VDDSTRLISDFVGDQDLGANIERAVTTGILLALAAVAIGCIVGKTRRRDRLT
jgi:hypothetical protein